MDYSTEWDGIAEVYKAEFIERITNRLEDDRSFMRIVGKEIAHEWNISVDLQMATLQKYLTIEESVQRGYARKWPRKVYNLKGREKFLYEFFEDMCDTKDYITVVGGRAFSTFGISEEDQVSMATKCFLTLTEEEVVEGHEITVSLLCNILKLTRCISGTYVGRRIEYLCPCGNGDDLSRRRYVGVF